MKKVISVILAMCMVFALCACSNTETATPTENAAPAVNAAPAENAATSDKTMTIGLIPQSTLFVFYDYVQKGAQDAAAEAGYTINYQGTTTDTDGTGQREIVEDMMVTGVDAIAISATNPDAVNDLLASLEVPVIAWDCSLAETSVCTTVSVDHYNAASSVAKYMMEKFPDGGKFAVISTNAGNAVIQQRANGFIETLGEGYECIGVFYTDGDLEKTMNTTQDLLLENEDLVGIFMTNEGCTEGVCQALETENRSDIAAFGYDTSEALINYVYNGLLDGMVSQNPYGLGYNAVKLAIAAAEGQTEFESFVANDHVLITAENIHDSDIIEVLDPLGTMNLS